MLYEIARERSRQDVQWGEQNHPDGTEESRWDKEAAVRARALCQHLAARGELTWTAILSEEIAEAYAETDPAKLREELIQVAAVAVAWVEAIDRRTA
ncbi:hypothetical protein GVV04_04855 [Micromonospora sp. NEAU-HG-1]|nr:hypothetical protein [Micromonospora rubida]